MYGRRVASCCCCWLPSCCWMRRTQPCYALLGFAMFLHSASTTKLNSSTVAARRLSDPVENVGRLDTATFSLSLCSRSLTELPVPATPAPSGTESWRRPISARLVAARSSCRDIARRRPLLGRSRVFSAGFDYLPLPRPSPCLAMRS